MAFVPAKPSAHFWHILQDGVFSPAFAVARGETPPADSRCMGRRAAFGGEMLIDKTQARGTRGGPWVIDEVGGALAIRSGWRTTLGFNRIGIGFRNSGDICHCAKMLRQQIMRMDSVDENGAAVSWFQLPRQRLA
ncbi:MAG: hypothetical protein CM15mP115_08890 [Alphaproteobacteria bacterium]|nr:MAG: hypothetical protein CM15mP115_08890 [Alphaproteobacteria bacterium]